VHLDGYNSLDYFMGASEESPRDWFFYSNDDGLIAAIRYGDWMAVFYEQRFETMQFWAEPFVELRFRRSSTSAATPSSGPTRTPTVTGCWNTFRLVSDAGARRRATPVVQGISRPDRSPDRSTLTESWSRWPTPAEAAPTKPG
jgi:hypothetical protein